MKHHERRELVNTLTKIAREYGQTQQLRERIAHALPFDCDLIDAPSVEDARAVGRRDLRMLQAYYNESADGLAKKLK